MDNHTPELVRSSHPPHAGRLNRQSGLSLVELMISVTIGLMLMAGITSLIAQQSSASTELDKASRQIENGRYASQVLREDVELAGFYGEFYNVPAPTTIVDPCDKTIATLASAISLPIQGYDSPATVPSPLSACLANGNHVSGTDILIVRHAETSTVDVASAVAGQPYLQSGINVSNTMAFVVGSGSDTSVFTLKRRTGGTAPLRAYAVHIYFVSPCNVPASGTTCNGSTDDGGTSIPTLKRMELTVSGGAAAFTTVALAEGIENMQLDYGIDSETSPDGSANYYTTGTNTDAGVAMTAADWGNIMTIRVNLLARNTERTLTYDDKKTYSLGTAGTVGPFHDSYKRRVFSEVIRATNPSGRRPLS
ncbi:PilW family protein [Herbaspirillum sp. ST 5-3]|uniref:PilW family protein n=1 Tax=Herbaspirillum sp. ST 5-3 TaxID=2567936 RepID=UPI0010A42EE2|nr:PilW family protein [Herbaspirillum sp. ST 5-3]